MTPAVRRVRRAKRPRDPIYRQLTGRPLKFVASRSTSLRRSARRKRKPGSSAEERSRRRYSSFTIRTKAPNLYTYDDCEHELR